MNNCLLSSRYASKDEIRGSALITSIIFSFLIGALAVTFLKLATSEYKSSVRSTLYSSSLNLAESGVEMAVEDLRNGSFTSETGKGMKENYLVDRSYKGDVRYVVKNADTLEPTIYAEGIVKGHPTGDVVKQVKVTVERGFYPFEYGIAALNGIYLIGNTVEVDSYNSDYGPYGSFLDPFDLKLAPDGFGVSGYNKNDNVYVASDLINVLESTAVDGGNADVYGYVTVSAGNDAYFKEQNGKVTSYEDGEHDPSRILSDFYADFPSEENPDGFYDTTTYTDITKENAGEPIVGSSDPDNPTVYQISSINLTGNSLSSLEIEGHVAFVMEGDISVSGGGSITINEDSSLEIYTSGDVQISGGGVTNKDGIPSDFAVYGTAEPTIAADGTVSASQTIDITGNGVLAGVVYAPAGDVTLSGGGSDGEVFGGIVGLTATVAGNSSFHFDEALREIFKVFGVYTVKSWLELTNETSELTRLDMSEYF